MTDIIYKKGTKVMGWESHKYRVCGESFDTPFVGKVFFYDDCNSLYDIETNYNFETIRVSENSIMLFEQEIYDEVVELYNKAQEHHNKFHECFTNMRKLLTSKKDNK